jgi:CRP/FNR family transcriptional regulator
MVVALRKYRAPPVAMLTLSDLPSSSARVRAAPGSHRTLMAGEILFREGEPRSCVYRVEKGSVCLFKQRPDGTRDVIEFAFPGDLVGLGYLDNHIAGAQATMETSLTCLPRSAGEPVIERTVGNASRLAAAIEREVAFLNEAQSRGVVARPLARIAALFVTLARVNAYEGRDPTLITDSLSCGVVAGYLNMTVDELGHWLAELKARNLVEPCARGLRLTNVDELERLSETAD